MHGVKPASLVRFAHLPSRSHRIALVGALAVLGGALAALGCGGGHDAEPISFGAFHISTCPWRRRATPPTSNPIHRLPSRALSSVETVA